MKRQKEKYNMKPMVTDDTMCQVIIDSSLAGLLVVDGNGIILKANPQSERMFGYKDGVLINKNINVILSKRYRKELQVLMEATTSDSIQILAKHHEGYEFVIDIRMVKKIIEGQTIIAVYCKPSDRGVFESDRKLRTLIGNVPGIVYSCQVDQLWAMEFISNTCLEISGYAPEQFYDPKNFNWSSLIYSEDKDKVVKEIKKAISKSRSYQLSYRIVTATNNIKWIWDTGSCVEDETGKVYLLEGIIQDVTEQKSAEKALSIEKKKLWQYLDTTASIFLVINIDHTIAMVNRKACEVLGYEAREIEGKNWFHSCIPRGEQKELIRFFDRIIEGTVKPPDVYENWVVAKGSKRKLIRWQNALLKDENDRITGLISSGVDVTEEVISKQKLQESEEKNRAILEALPDVMTIHDKKGTLLEVHIPDESNLIATKEELAGKKVTDFLSKEIGVKLKKTISKVIRSQQMETLEVDFEGENSTVNYECRLVPLNEIHALSIARNITETKAVQNTLHIRNRALGAAGNGIIIVDAQQPDLPIIYGNNAFSRMTGYRQSEILGRNCRFLQNDDRDQEELKTLAIAIQNGKPCRVILRNYRKDGTLFWNELSVTPLYDETQRLTHFIGVQNDITEIQLTKDSLEDHVNKMENKVKERTKEIEATVQKLVETNLNLEDQMQVTKLAENKAKRSQAQFAAIAKNFPKGLIVVFNTVFELVYVEGEELKRVNLIKSDFVGKCVDDVPIFSERQIERIKEDVEKTIEGKSLSFEVEFQGDFYAVNSTPLKSDGEGINWALFVYNNITEQKNAQEELAKALKVEQELNELKSRFISMASHEFRTPLSAILSSAILIGKQNEPGKEERREKHVARIRTHVKHLVVILNDFLSLSKLEEGKVQAKPQHFELIQFCKILVDETEATKKEEQTIHLKGAAVEIPVNLDPKLLNHILVNLLSNALKYSEEGKEVVMEIQRTKEAVSFHIKDNGIGIPKKEQEHLFERFFRAENATNIQGTGLGLHIVKQYAELMGGTVSFISKTGKGSTFTVKLPLNLEHYEKNIIN